jgi:hypothetical protein
VSDDRSKGIYRRVPKAPGFEVTAQMALVRRRGRTLDCSIRIRTKLIMHRVARKPTYGSANGSKRQGYKSLRFFEDGQSRHVGLDR